MNNKKSECSIDETSKAERREKSNKTNMISSLSTMDNSFKEKVSKLVVSQTDDVTEANDTVSDCIGSGKLLGIRKDSLVRSEDGTSTIRSMTREEDSLLLEAKKDAASPSPSDYEGGSGGHKIGVFFNSPSDKWLNINADSESSNNPDEDLHSTRESLKKFLEMGNQYRLKANVLFKKNKFKDSLMHYLNAVGCLNTLIELNKKHDMLNMTNVNWVRMECLNNISVCYLLLKDYSKVLDYTKEVLEINSKNFIALSYRAKALIALELNKEALNEIKLALSIKYSKSLMIMLKEVEDKINAEKLRNNIINGEILLTNDNKSNVDDVNNQESKDNLDNSEENSRDKPLKNSLNTIGPLGSIRSIYNSIHKFIKISTISCSQKIKKYKFILLILLLIWVFVFRRRLKIKLFELLKIHF